MTPNALPPLWSRYAVFAISLAIVFSVGCSNVPRRYLRMAESGTTLTMLAAHPEHYRGKVVLLGGTIVEEEEQAEYLWLRMTNRPLDQDYVPHRPPIADGPEAGSYWLIVPRGQLPTKYRQWARMTVVGRVTDGQRLAEPVLAPVYVRGWGISGDHDGIWEYFDPNYMPSVPGGLRPK